MSCYFWTPFNESSKVNNNATAFHFMPHHSTHTHIQAMSRRPTSTTSGMRQPSAVSRTASSASLAMPPPNRIPSNSNRPVSSASSSGNTNGNGHGQEVASGSRQASPKKGRKTVGPSGGGSGNAGEINIQVVVRLRSVRMEPALSGTDDS